MSDILPPQLVGVQQRSLYVKARTVLTVISSVWLVMAVTGVGFFSGGTTSLALSLILLYGTGVALIVVIAGIYRLVKKSAVRRAESVPDDTAALAFVDTTRSATEELRAALRPPAATGRQYAPVARTVGPAVSMSDAVAAARAASIAAAVASAVAEAAAAEETPARPAVAKKRVAAASTVKPTAKTAASAPAGKAGAKAAAATVKAPAKEPARTTAAKTTAAKTTAKPAAPKSPVNKSAAAKSPAKKQQKPRGANPQVKNAAPKTAAPKTAAPKTAAPKGRPVSNPGSKSASLKRPGASNRVPGKKQSGSSGADAAAGTSGPAASVSAKSQQCSPAKGQRPSLVLASSNPAPQAARPVHEALTRQRAS
ncbi:hypothetical protein ABIB35_003154 [Arthrobacter sp. UYP6]|uniref:hypothetical protein n=1 Tax=Arthrobacter sp. UYP6 TaxID=1756378 RepID=UPI0033986E18